MKPIPLVDLLVAFFLVILVFSVTKFWPNRHQ